jgi:hypothetical protein
MSNVYTAKTSFNGGVQTPLVQGMIDAPRGASSFQDSLNAIPIKHGPIMWRGGTEHIVPSNGADWDGKRSHIIPFRFNNTQSYILEFSYADGLGRLRVFRNRGIVLNSLASVNQAISEIGAYGNPFKVYVADNTGYTAGHDLVFSISAGATELDGKLTTIATKGTDGTGDYLSVSGLGIPDYTVGATTGTAIEVYEVTLPYDGDDLFETDGTFRLDVQSINDVMYMVHPDHQPRILARTAHDVWTVTKMAMKKGPYLPNNDEKKQKVDLTPLRTESNTTDFKYTTATTRLGDESNEGTFDLWLASDVQATDTNGLASTGGTSTGSGRQFSMYIPEGITNDNGEPQKHRWHHFRIVKFISETEVWLEQRKEDRDWRRKRFGADANIQIKENYKGVDTGVDQWALGAFSDSSGYPEVVEIHDGRLVMGNTTSEPRNLHFSRSGAFSSTDSTWNTVNAMGQVFDDLGFNADIGGGDSSPVEWIISSSDGLLVGTSVSEGVIGEREVGAGFIPGNVTYRKYTSVGSKSIQPVVIDQATLFVSRTGRRVHEMLYELASNGQKAPDLTEMAEHVTKTGIIDFAFQREPHNILWCVLADGKVIGFTYDKESDIIAWHQHEFGGETTAAITGFGADVKSKARSVAVIPSTDGLTDDVWFIVDRHTFLKSPGGPTNFGTAQGSVEILAPLFDDDTDIKNAVQMDSYIKSSTAIVSKEIDSDGTLSGYSDGDILLISNTEPSTGFTEDPNNMYYLVDTNVLKTLSGGSIDFGIDFEADVQVTTTTFDGVELFLQKNVKIFADGRELPDQEVAWGVNTLSEGNFAANLTIGYPYSSFVELDHIESSGMNNLDQGKTKRINKVMVRLRNTLGLKAGGSEATLIPIDFDDDQDISEFMTLKNGDYVVGWEEGWEQSGKIRFQSDGSFPSQIQLIVAEMEVNNGFPSSR